MKRHETSYSAHKIPYSAHEAAFLSWFETKTNENDYRKALLLESEGRPIPRDNHSSKQADRAMIVVVDDEPAIAVTLAEILERHNYIAPWFTDPVAALNFMESRKPDLLLADVNMPILDGFNLALSVKGMYRDCPILFVSAIGNDPELILRMISAGVFIASETKPVQICRLLSRIADLISLETRLQPSAQHSRSEDRVSESVHTSTGTR
jgi:CheY-like chemotaxis protein